MCWKRQLKESFVSVVVCFLQQHHCQQTFDEILSDMNCWPRTSLKTTCRSFLPDKKKIKVKDELGPKCAWIPNHFSLGGNVCMTELQNKSIESKHVADCLCEAVKVQIRQSCCIKLRWRTDFMWALKLLPGLQISGAFHRQSGFYLPLHRDFPFSLLQIFFSDSELLEGKRGWKVKAFVCWVFHFLIISLEVSCKSLVGYKNVSTCSIQYAEEIFTQV